MEILGKTTSLKLDSIYREAVTAIKKEIRFAPISSHPLPSFRENSGVVEEGEFDCICYLNENLSVEKFEHVAAHELYHLILHSEGYPNTFCLPEHKTYSDQWKRKVCSMLGSSVLDLEIKNRLSNQRGYDIWSIKEKDGMVVLEDLKQQNELPTIWEDGGNVLALKYMVVRYWCSSGLSAAIEAQAERINIELKEVGLELRRIVDEYGHDSPENATQSMVGIRNALKLNRWCKIMVPSTRGLL